MIALHLGAHKTASTHLQQALASAGETLRRAGVCYLGPDELRGGVVRLGGIAGGSGKVIGTGPLRKMIAAARAAVLSDENVLGHPHAPGPRGQPCFYPMAGQRLARVLEAVGTDAALFLAVRDPAGYLVSSYCQQLYAGTVGPFEAFLSGCDPARMAWSELVGRLCEVPGVRHCTIWRYEDWPGVSPQIWAALLPDGLAADVAIPRTRVHPGLSQRAHDAVMHAHDAGQADARSARKARLAYPKGPDYAAFDPFRAEERAASAAAYAADLAHLAALPGVTMLQPGAGQG